MADFKQGFAHVLANEGFYSNNPNDRGAETLLGIARKPNPQWNGWVVVDQMRKEPGFPKNLKNNISIVNCAQEFYKSQYWDKIKGDQITEQEIAVELFDTAVNMGVGVASKFVQDALNLLNRNGKSYRDITEDGIIGKDTLQLLNDFPDTTIMLRTLNALQAALYIKICELDPTQEEFFRGWLKRAS
jgi:lysozyme family protein